MKNMQVERAIEIDVKDVVADENQPRKYFDSKKLAQLKDSVQKHGILSPLTVEKVGNGYLLVDGERRYRVATDLKLKTIPAIVLKPQNAIDRLVQQFHIQEQHEGWTPTEKAITLSKLADELGVTIKQAATLLSLEERTARRYAAFAEIIAKNDYQRNEVPLEFVENIQSLKRQTRKLYNAELKEEFTRDEEKRLELAVIKRVKSGDIKRRLDIIRIKDAFTQNSKLIEKFINTDVSIQKFLIDSNSQGAYHLRNALYNARYINTHIKHFMRYNDVKLTAENVGAFKGAKKSIEALLDKVE